MAHILKLYLEFAWQNVSKRGGYKGIFVIHVMFLDPWSCKVSLGISYFTKYMATLSRTSFCLIADFVAITNFIVKINLASWNTAAS